MDNIAVQRTLSSKTNSTDMIVEPYGESLEVTTRAPQWPQGMAYTGHVLDNLTRITYAQARYYDQLMGRFMSVDPVGPDAGNFNRYWYANANPFSNIDPDGRQAQDAKSRACKEATLVATWREAIEEVQAMQG